MEFTYSESYLNDFVSTFIDKLLSYFTDKVRIIGSCALVLAHNHMIPKKIRKEHKNVMLYSQDKFIDKKFVQTITKDIDILIEMSTITELMEWFVYYGKIEMKNNSYPQKNSTLKRRGIQTISSFNIIFDNTSDDIGVNTILSKNKIDSFSLSIDVTALKNMNNCVCGNDQCELFSKKVDLEQLINTYAPNWPIHCSMRNLIVWKKDSEILINQFKKKIKSTLKTNRLTVMWLFETLKYIHWKEHRLASSEVIINTPYSDEEELTNSQYINNIVYHKINTEYYEFPSLDSIFKTESCTKDDDTLCTICQESFRKNTNISYFSCKCLHHTICIVDYMLIYFTDYIKQLNQYEKLPHDIRQSEPRVYHFNDVSGERIIVGHKCPHCQLQILPTKFGNKIIGTIDKLDWTLPDLKTI